MDKFFGFRLGYIVVSYVVLRATLMNSVSVAATCGSFILFLLPFAFEYFNMLSASRIGKILKEVGMWTSIFGCMASIALMLHELFSKNNNGVTEVKTEHMLLNTLPLEIFWLICGFWVFLGVIDWVVYSTPKEKEFRKELRNLERKKQSSTITFEERVEHYKGRSLES
ncbi:hypothetical protein [Paenibacillus larvae]|uniref:Uncharacterized protein n=1 Tax=Paenibacillus larvae subsp. larvae TaxID=147375 RepID=A0A2L1U2G8_9BACL|nr:hypothetical protein [Paenibacillus larvae]AQZ45578.1 hypothetical protein B5S25_02170 [Paenibacillus larvae subsp. pulvifaciens]AVF27094.1 hypothetical protein ERICIII_02967 [Paenibacillus larvae subsp. larvae]AVF27577.1 hypothetical protein ERICIII_03467 [Paenibacillus larvae subsp. larvae]MBH0344019.1 hypothetical protein [Paenibacillus larvae]MCY7520889.1 hypothetical protein [Paenibacillus larvae]